MAVLLKEGEHVFAELYRMGISTEAWSGSRMPKWDAWELG